MAFQVTSWRFTWKFSRHCLQERIPKLGQNSSGWWFQIFFIFTPIWGRFPFWLIFFKWVGSTTNQSCYFFPSFTLISASAGQKQHQWRRAPKRRRVARKEMRRNWARCREKAWRCLVFFGGGWGCFLETNGVLSFFERWINEVKMLKRIDSPRDHGFRVEFAVFPVARAFLKVWLHPTFKYPARGGNFHVTP